MCQDVQIVAQYYNFLRLGREGYTRIQRSCQETALYLSGEIATLGPFELITDGSELPVFAFKLKEEGNFTLFDMSERLRYSGWLVPAYTMPKNREDLLSCESLSKKGSAAIWQLSYCVICIQPCSISPPNLVSHQNKIGPTSHIFSTFLKGASTYG